jgi:glutathione peroxidase-family protein
MKLFFLLAILYNNELFSQGNIYDLALTTLSGKTISLADYKGRKILIAPVIPDSLQNSGILSYWDSLQAANPKVVLILIPASDLNNTPNSVALENTSYNIVLSAGAEVKKDKGTNQNPIMQWLTHSGKNSHFNADVETDNQLFIISESGVLYAVLDKGVRQQEVDNVLKQTEVKQQALISTDKQK